jgi:hypothetical protein
MRHGPEQAIRVTEIVSTRQTGFTFPAADPGRDKHSLPDRNAINHRTDLLYDSRYIRSRDMWQWYGICRITLSDPDIKMVQRAGFDTDQDILRTDSRRRHVLIG